MGRAPHDARIGHTAWRAVAFVAFGPVWQIPKGIWRKLLVHGRHRWLRTLLLPLGCWATFMLLLVGIVRQFVGESEWATRLGAFSPLHQVIEGLTLLVWQAAIVPTPQAYGYALLLWGITAATSTVLLAPLYALLAGRIRPNLSSNQASRPAGPAAD